MGGCIYWSRKSSRRKTPLGPFGTEVSGRKRSQANKPQGKKTRTAIKTSQGDLPRCFASSIAHLHNERTAAKKPIVRTMEREATSADDRAIFAEGYCYGPEAGKGKDFQRLSAASISNGARSSRATAGVTERGTMSKWQTVPSILRFVSKSG